ncbi:hypothetical protein LEMA_P023880.1 [Plenodomus lingam JN3]|uniref:BAH domain-containing protein n=1 Tax=Leptosphaeria maculans (strain JN3 / isolate v23.1.3 / race Av1-4-5-6-7-8) TaxID=985895 RepID=E4ZX26_LEPMJ|nr:hypothetical protein LEMA_P023880.1 [Plenodomus lingam JN3]CBX95236.1 hypothetical protein LEMA_P023880.1 [Plenodomus lingam JN3]
MARKRKVEELRESSSDPLSALHAKRTTSTKVDWSTIDLRDDFDGFQLSAIRRKTKKEAVKPVTEKQKTAIKTSRATENYKNASMSAQVAQENPFPETDLADVYCKVEPAREWESTQRYRKFTISGEEFEINNFVFIKKDADQSGTREVIEHWIAKVLEVRAGDSLHVYLRVYWVYRPEDLPEGRQRHDGECELIVSNHMDIIDAQCVQGAADVIYWDDSPDSSKFPAPDQLYWRQALDITKRKGSQLTKLNTYCVDKKPSNPDESLVQCPSCSIYLHARCLEEHAGKAAYKQHAPAQSKKSKDKWRDSFEATLSTSDTKEPRLTVTDKRKRKNNTTWHVDIHCLSCSHLIACAPTTVPTPSTPSAQLLNDDEIESESENPSITQDPSSPPAPLDAANLAIGDLPTSATAPASPPAASPAALPKRGRGRPRGSKKKKRGRQRRIKIEDPTGGVGSVASAADDGVVDVKTEEGERNTLLAFEQASRRVTPTAQLPVPGSLFRSGVRSVQRLLWMS